MPTVGFICESLIQTSYCRTTEGYWFLFITRFATFDTSASGDLIGLSCRDYKPFGPSLILGSRISGSSLCIENRSSCFHRLIGILWNQPGWFSDCLHDSCLGWPFTILAHRLLDVFGWEIFSICYFVDQTNDVVNSWGIISGEPFAEKLNLIDICHLFKVFSLRKKGCALFQYSRQLWASPPLSGLKSIMQPVKILNKKTKSSDLLGLILTIIRPNCPSARYLFSRILKIEELDAPSSKLCWKDKMHFPQIMGWFYKYSTNDSWNWTSLRDGSKIESL